MISLLKYKCYTVSNSLWLHEIQGLWHLPRIRWLFQIYFNVIRNPSLPFITQLINYFFLEERKWGMKMSKLYMMIISSKLKYIFHFLADCFKRWYLLIYYMGVSMFTYLLNIKYFFLYMKNKESEIMFHVCNAVWYKKRYNKNFTHTF